MQALIPNPLHPAVVHLPIALAVLLPLFALGALVLIRRGARPRNAWSVTVALTAALLVSGWVSLQTGEQQEERVEDIVAEQSIHGHEEAAETFLLVAAGVLVLGLAGLAPGRWGQAGRWATTIGTLAVFGAGWRVGHTGGMLVYRDGAASAYTGNTQPRSVGGDVVRPGEKEDEDRRRR